MRDEIATRRVLRSRPERLFRGVRPARGQANALRRDASRLRLKTRMKWRRERQTSKAECHSPCKRPLRDADEP